MCTLVGSLWWVPFSWVTGLLEATEVEKKPPGFLPPCSNFLQRDTLSSLKKGNEEGKSAWLFEESWLTGRVLAALGMEAHSEPEGL